ncbi:uncharacterized protein LOC144348213 [Saccoglossus kowalevskii]
MSTLNQTKSTAIPTTIQVKTEASSTSQVRVDDEPISFMAKSIIAGSIVASVIAVVFLTIIGSRRYTKCIISEGLPIITESREKNTCDGNTTQKVCHAVSDNEQLPDNLPDSEAVDNVSTAISCDMLHPLVYDEWEFPRKKLLFNGELLGQGEFGEVRLAYVEDIENCTKKKKVAVKCLRGII